MADYLPLKEAFDVASRYARALEPMWPAVPFRMVAVPDDASLTPAFAVLACHLQGSPTPHAPDARVRMRNPLVLDGYMTVDDMTRMLAAWSAGEDYIFQHWTLKPPAGLTSLLWQKDLPAEPGLQLIEDLPSFQSRYRLARLSGSGETLEQTLHARLLEAIYSMRQTSPHPVLWSREFLAADWQVTSTYVSIELPIAVGIEATYDAAAEQLNVAVHHRPPLTPADFEVRVGSGGWDASRPFQSLQLVSTDIYGWDVSACLVSRSAGGIAKVWTHWIASENDFDWEVTVDLGRPDSRELRRERFLADWYRLAQADLAAHVRPRSARQQKGDRDSDALEVAIGNACGALGMSVLFGGKIVETAGLDLVAFDSDPSSSVAYAVSVTIDNKIAEKLRQWLRVAEAIRATLEPLWSVLPVIVTSDPASALPPSEVQEAAQCGVRVLDGGDLAALMEIPPDIQAFAEALAREPKEEHDVQLPPRFSSSL